ncbi:hypothetical protein SUGI_0485630 [Cryptomeria japonica]|nr:hypothetical protein SUGI_0485630 [Cryptomeria japonica]
MLKTGTPIIPIFYHVQRAHLRHLKGNYESSFTEYQEKGRYVDKFEEWKKALYNVSFYEGEIVNDNEEEQKQKQRVLKNIVNRVLKIMKRGPLEVATHPVGLKEAVAEFEMKNSESAKNHSNVQLVGIWGMGGSGKTTLAKELYNKKCSSIEKSSFVFDVRTAASKNELHIKQRQLLEDFGFKFSDQPFDNIEQGKMILSNYLTSLPVFIILDDVDHRDQLEILLPGKASLASGSLIIVTTRDKEVLKVCGISCIYVMKSMNQSHAKQRFCWHAFLKSSPLSGFEDLVEKFVCASNGLPLSLKVLGGQLHGWSNKDLWEDVLHKISRILPDDIINRLRVRYDALDKEEQQMFLDVACFFIGKNKTIAISVWEGSGWSGLWGWERLVNKCLVEVIHKNEIRMHDHLRDLGREIARTLVPHRLWSPNQLTLIIKQEERLEIDGGKCWEVSDIESWENVQRLTSVQLIAKKKSAVLPCIQTIQKWPEDITIFTKAVAGAGSFLSSQAFPKLSVVHSFANEEIISYNKNIEFELLNHPSDGNAMMLCLVIKRNSFMRLNISWRNDRNISAFRGWDMEEGKWTWIGVFTQHSECLAARKWCIYGSIMYGECEVEKGMVVRGDEESVVKGFHRLLTLLAC